MSDILSDLDSILASKEDIRDALNANGAEVGDLMASYARGVNAVASVKTVNGVNADANKNVQLDAGNINVDDTAQTPQTIKAKLQSLPTIDMICTHISDGAEEGSVCTNGGCYANALNSFATGNNTTASGEHQFVAGRMNIEDTNDDYIVIIGNGNDDNGLVYSNAHTIDWDGNAWYQGNVYVKGTNQNTGSHVLIADNTLVEYKYRDKTGLLDQNNLTNYIKEKYDSSCTGVASVEYCGEPGNNVMYAVYYYQGGYLTNWQIGIYKYHSPANDDVYVVQDATRTSENGEINNVTSDTTSQAFLRYLYTTGLTNITIQYNGGGRFPEFYDCTTTYTLSGTNATCVCSGTNFSNYDSIRAKLTYSSGTVVYTDEYETSGGIVCFSKDTLIDTENGFKTIQDIEVGDKVYSYNFKTDEIELKEVDKIFNHNVNEIVSIYTEREIIKATKGHPFYIAYNQTKMAKNLKPNDLLRTKQNLFRPVKQIVINEVNNKEVYEIRVKDNNNYFVGSEGILVYNEPNIIE